MKKIAMRFNLTLQAEQDKTVLPLNYQYPLSAIIYKILNQADAEYAHFLHEEGYQRSDSSKRFKFFTFSDIRVPFKIESDRMVVEGCDLNLIVCFHVPKAAESFVKGLFMNRTIEIADKKSKASFVVKQVEALSLWDNPVQADDVKEVVLRPISPLVVGAPNERRRYTFFYPTDERFIPALLLHWKEKYKVMYGDEAGENDFRDIEIALLNPEGAKSRLITIKADTPEQTKIRGFTGFQLKVRAKAKALELAFDAGIAIYGSLGMGCVEVMS